MRLQSFYSFLLLFLFALGSFGMQVPALIVNPAEAAEEDQTTEHREEEPIRNAASRKHRARGTVKKDFIKLPLFVSAARDGAEIKLSSHFSPLLLFAVAPLHLLQVFRI